MRLNEDQMENAIGIGFNQMSGTPPDGGRCRDPHALHAGGIFGTGRRHGRGARAPRHHRLQGDRRGPLRHLQDLHPRQRAGLECDRWTDSARAFRCWRSTASRCGRRAAIRGRPMRRRCTCASSTACAPEDVESITIVGGTGGTQLLCEPLELKRRPQGQHRRQVQHSVHYRGDDGERQRHSARLHARGAVRSGGARHGGSGKLPRRNAADNGQGRIGRYRENVGGDRDAGRQQARAPAQRRAGRSPKTR